MTPITTTDIIMRHNRTTDKVDITETMVTTIAKT